MFSNIETKRIISAFFHVNTIEIPLVSILASQTKVLSYPNWLLVISSKFIWQITAYFLASVECFLNRTITLFIDVMTWFTGQLGIYKCSNVRIPFFEVF